MAGRLLPIASRPTDVDHARASELALLRSRTPRSEKEWLETQRRIAELEAS
jgi:hypothetical protein